MGRSTHRTLDWYRRILLPLIEDATSSPESGDGHSHSNSPDGLPTDLSGRDLAPVSHSRPQGKGRAKRTLDISGPPYSGSSASAALSAALGSRLRELLASTGSMEFRQTWKVKATPSGRLFWAHTASGLPTAVREFTGWPTLTERDRRSLKGARDRPGKAGGASLMQVLLNAGESEGYLNPSFACWLMGYPQTWVQSRDSGTPSSRKSRPCS